MRTLTVPREAWFIRFFLWVWAADPEKVNLCKLVWGILLSPLAVFRLSIVFSSLMVIVIGVSVLIILLSIQMIFVLDMQELVEWIFVACLFSFGIFMAGFGNYFLYETRNETVEKKSQEGLLSKVSRLGAQTFDSSMEFTFCSWVGPVEKVADGLMERHKINSFFDAVVEYVRAKKEQHCPMVRIV